MIFKHLVTTRPLHSAVLLLEVHLLRLSTLTLDHLHKRSLEPNMLGPGGQPVAGVGGHRPGDRRALANPQKLVPAVRLHLPGADAVAQAGLDNVLQVVCRANASVRLALCHRVE